VHITTERLILRRMQDSDLQNFLEYEQHPDHSRYFYRSPYSEEQAKAFIAENRDLEPGAEGTYLHLVVELASSGKMIGTVCVNVTSQAHWQGDVGWFFHPDYLGQGFATEASRALLEFVFTRLELHRITAFCDADNERSRQMMERLGMRREAHYQDAAFFDGVWHNQFAYAMLEQEWKACR
jgi:RimJ/RimL family protein N-acetyltransferase